MISTALPRRSPAERVGLALATIFFVLLDLAAVAGALVVALVVNLACLGSCTADQARLARASGPAAAVFGLLSLPVTVYLIVKLYERG